jgi:hypothetical protein
MTGLALPIVAVIVAAAWYRYTTRRARWARRRAGARKGWIR